MGGCSPTLSFFNSRKAFSSCLSQRKGFPRVSPPWPWLHLSASKEQVKTQRSGSLWLCCFPGKDQETSLLAGKRASSVAPHVSPSVSWKKENFCGSPHPLSPQRPPAGITAVSPHLFLPPFSSLRFFPLFASCLMVSHHKHHWQALSRVGSAWETGLAAEELRRHLPGDELPPSPGGPWTGGFPGAAKPGTQVRFVQFSRARKVHVSNIQGNQCLVCLSTGAQKEVRPVCHQYPAIQGCPGKLLMGLCGKTSSGKIGRAHI